MRAAGGEEWASENGVSNEGVINDEHSDVEHHSFRMT